MDGIVSEPESHGYRQNRVKRIRQSLLLLLLVAMVACAAPNLPVSPRPSELARSVTTGGAAVTREPTESNSPTLATTPTSGPESQSSSSTFGQLSSEIPPDLVARITDHAIETFGLSEDQIRVTRAEEVEWSDGSLGCPEPGMLYTQAIVRGYWVELKVGDLVFDYRTAVDGTFRLCSSDGVVLPSDVPPVGGDKTESGYSTGGDS